MTHYNVDLTIETRDSTNPEELEKEVRHKLEAQTPEDLILDVELCQRIEEVKQ